MKITVNEPKGTVAGVRFSADVIWENAEPTENTIWFEVLKPHCNLAICNPDAFLVAAAIPAYFRGEDRIQIDAEVSPEMIERTRIVLTWMKSWFTPDKPIPELHLTPRKSPLVPNPPRVAGSFFSGGVDALTVVRMNRQQFTNEHPWYLRFLLLVLGFDVNDEATQLHAERHCSAIASDVEANLLVVKTNVRHLVHDPEYLFWMHHFFAAATTSVGHLFVNSFDTAFFGSSYDIPNVLPWGSHPCLDWTYGSSSLEIVHDGHHLSRLDKIAVISDWKAAIDHIRVCGPVKGNRTNCERCEKCIRTMLELQSVGALSNAGAFEANRVDPHWFDDLTLWQPFMLDYYCELLPGLRSQGDPDIVLAVERLIARGKAEFQRLERNQRIKAIDMRLTGGRIWKVTAGAKHKLRGG